MLVPMRVGMDRCELPYVPSGQLSPTRLFELGKSGTRSVEAHCMRDYLALTAEEGHRALGQSSSGGGFGRASRSTASRGVSFAINYGSSCGPALRLLAY